MNPTTSTVMPGHLRYEKTSQGFVFGISFTLRNGNRLMAPYAYLSQVEMPSSEEAAFVYSFGVVRIKGRNVETIYDLAHRHQLGAVSCGESCEDEDDSTDGADILFKKFEDKDD